MQFGEAGSHSGSIRLSFRRRPTTCNFYYVRSPAIDEWGYTPSADDDRELFEGIESLYVLPEEQRTLRNLVYGLPPHLAPVLRPWIAEGRYASVFDNSRDTLTFSHFQAFDFQGMDELYPQVLEPLLFYIFQRISQVVYDPAFYAFKTTLGR